MNEITDEKLRQLGTVKCSTYCDLVQGACIHEIARAALEAREKRYILETEVRRITSARDLCTKRLGEVTIEVLELRDRAERAEARVTELEDALASNPSCPTRIDPMAAPESIDKIVTAVHDEREQLSREMGVPLDALAMDEVNATKRPNNEGEGDDT